MLLDITITDLQVKLLFKNLQETISRVFASQKVDNESLILFEDTLIQADIDIETSEKIINELRLENTGRFWDYNGELIPW